MASDGVNTFWTEWVLYAAEEGSGGLSKELIEVLLEGSERFMDVGDDDDEGKEREGANGNNWWRLPEPREQDACLLK